jgi:hypothetical protein
MAADPTVIGLTLAKINGLYRVDVRNARWSTRRAAQQHITGAGVRQSIGEEVPSGSFDEVIPRDKQFNWRALKNFSIEVYDKETRTILVFGCEGCNWSGLDGSSDLGQANTSKAIAWIGTKVTAT